MTAPEILRDCHGHALLAFKAGRKLLHAVALHAPPVRVVRMPLLERRVLVPLLYQGKPYPVARAVRQFRKAGTTLGITRGAAAVLRGLKRQGPVVSRPEPAAPTRSNAPGDFPGRDRTRPDVEDSKP